MTSPQLEAYRVAYAAIAGLRQQFDATCIEVAEAMRATAIELTPAAKRKSLVPVDGDARRTMEQWRKVVPPAKRAELDERWSTQTAPQREAFTRLMDQIDASRKLAFDVPDCVVGEGACWRMVRNYSGSGDREYYERGKANIRVTELRTLGYEVRPMRRPLRAEGGPMMLEVWVWTCEEGARIAYNQTPPGTLDDLIRTYANHGLNPIAASGNLLSVEQVNRAGGWQSTAQVAHVTWEPRAHGYDPNSA